MSLNTGSRNALDDLTGRRFGLLVVEERAENNAFGLVYWRLRCDCGAVVTRRANTLRSGRFFTCGAIECRFWEKVDKNGPVPTHCPELGPCWVWTGATNGGYGVLKVPGSKQLVRAHVFAWEQENGLLANGLFALHHCDNRPCVRGTHLFTGTHDDNMADAAEKGRMPGPGPRLSLMQVTGIVADAVSGTLTYRQIAEKYGTTERTVQRKVTEGRYIP